MFSLLTNALRAVAVQIATGLFLFRTMQKYHDDLDKDDDPKPPKAPASSKHLRLVAALLLSLVLAQPALAADGDKCTECAESQGSYAIYLCDSRTHTGGTTPVCNAKTSTGGWSETVVTYLNAPSNCTLPALLVEYTEAETPGSNTVWVTLDTLTYSAGTGVAQIIGLGGAGPTLRATWASDITDTDCGDIDVVLRKNK